MLLTLEGMKMRVLVIEDDKVVQHVLRKGLEENGCSVEIVDNGVIGLELAKQFDYDVLVIDRMLPEIDGLTIIRHLRQAGNDTPALFLTSMDEVEDKIDGLEAGCDDYMTKPFAFGELLARIKVLAKRKVRQGEDTLIRVQGLSLDKVSRQVERDGRPIHLQPREFDLLAYLATHQGQTVTREMLLHEVWGLDFDPQTNIVDVHISRLRGKIDKGFRDPLINTIRGQGYTFGL